MNQQICRCCLVEHPTITFNIFERDNLRFDLMECVPKLNITPNDGLPDLICDLCWLRVREAVDFKRKCEESDCQLRARCKEINKSHSIVSAITNPEMLNEKMKVIDEEAILYNATLELCELSPLEVSLLNEVSLEDCNNPPCMTLSREEDPVIIELLNSVLHDISPLPNKIVESPNLTECPPTKNSEIYTDNQSADITSTTTTSVNTPPNRRCSKNKPHTCTECGKKFTRNFQLKLHLTSVHNMGDGLQYTCNVCQKTFASRHSLSYHRKSLHTEERDFACSQCDRRFVLRSQLASHERIHTGEYKPRIHECPKCTKTWPTKSDLRTHMRSHDPNVERRFQCDQCEKRFFTRGHLSSHLLVHSGEKPFTCSICEKSFQSIGNLNNHLMKRHSEVVVSRLRNRHGELRNPIET